MTITYCDHHGEYYNSRQDDDDAARAEDLREAMRKVELEAADILKALVVKHFPAALNNSDREYVSSRVDKDVRGYLSDLVQDLACDDELLALVAED
jgi:hypothetical protein